jgi:hypothetical protein
MIICYGLDTYRATPDRHHYSERTVLFYFPPFAIAPLRSDLNSNIIESNKIQEQLLFYYEQPSHKPQHPLTIFNPFYALLPSSSTNGSLKSRKIFAKDTHITFKYFRTPLQYLSGI